MNETLLQESIPILGSLYAHFLFHVKRKAFKWFPVSGAHEHWFSKALAVSLWSRFFWNQRYLQTEITMPSLHKMEQRQFAVDRKQILQ